MSKKETIVGRLWRGVVLPIKGAADGLSWFLFVLAAATTALSFLLKFHVIEVHGSSDFFDRHYWKLVYLAWILFVVSTIGPLLHIAKERADIPLGMLASVAVIHVIMFLFISGVILITEQSTTGATNGVGAITTLLGAAAAAAMAGIGWVIQYQSSARSSRRAHTFTILMQSRLSKEFQEHVNNRSAKYPCPTTIPADDVKRLCLVRQQNEAIALFEERALQRCPATLTCAERTQVLGEIESERKELMRTINAFRAVKYLLNFYEFLSAGIKKRELDEELLFETLSSIAIGLYKDTEHVRKAAKDIQPMVYEHFEELIQTNWMKREEEGNRAARKSG